MHAVPDLVDDDTWTVRPARTGAARHRAQVPDRTLVLALRSIPIIGWIFLAVGVLRPFRSRPLRVIFWIDAFLSVVVHAAQVPAARREAAERGITPGRATAMTMLLGATWWKTLDPR
ncbi:hypothetical protein [Nocardia sp. AG03]|uniref:hypothetical protein n=1 Tax=Nocardia sp. AG03 TaxID=3025312 RepID=UPI00241857D2|nr:hypothetical protein [Nocardia sp. AG03]